MSDQACEFPKANATTDEIKAILRTNRTVAVVGLSDKTDRPSFRVAEYLQKQGYEIIPVNPMLEAWKGLKSYPDLKVVPVRIDVVDIFRRPEDVPAIVADAIQMKAKVIWMQEGIVHNASADQARKAGLRVVMNKCMFKEHQRLGA